MLASKTVCQRRLDDQRSGWLGAWRFFANDKVTAETIVDRWSERTREAVAGRHVLAIHDTTEVHFSTQPKRRRGLGKCGHGNAHGLLAHTMMAVDADTTACLGLITGQIWNRKTVQTTPLRRRAGGAGIAPLGGNRGGGQADPGQGGDGDGDLRPRGRHLPDLGPGAG
jgi:hypothetical protein